MKTTKTLMALSAAVILTGSLITAPAQPTAASQPPITTSKPPITTSKPPVTTEPKSPPAWQQPGGPNAPKPPVPPPGQTNSLPN